MFYLSPFLEIRFNTDRFTLCLCNTSFRADKLFFLPRRLVYTLESLTYSLTLVLHSFTLKSGFTTAPS